MIGYLVALAVAGYDKRGKWRKPKPQTVTYPGTLSVTIPIHWFTDSSDVRGVLYSIIDDIDAGKLKINESDEAIVHFGGNIAGMWEVKLGK